MLQAWLSIGYIVLLAVVVLAFILWRRGAPVLATAALVVGIPLWFGWEYARPTWTTGVITGTQVRRSERTPTVIRLISNTSKCATGPIGKKSSPTTIPGGD